MARSKEFCVVLLDTSLHMATAGHMRSALEAVQQLVLQKVRALPRDP